MKVLAMALALAGLLCFVEAHHPGNGLSAQTTKQLMRELQRLEDLKIKPDNPMNAKSEDMAAACVYAHNNVRRRHGAGDLTWDSNIAATAQVWAEYLRDNNPLYPHDPSTSYGENIASRTLDLADTMYECSDAVFGWYNEVNNYNFNNQGFSEATGHFTAVVWAATTKVGCGTAKAADNRQSIVCRYDPPGNMAPASNYEDNVSQLSSGQSYPSSHRDLEQNPCHDKSSTTSCNQALRDEWCDYDLIENVCWSTCGRC